MEVHLTQPHRIGLIVPSSNTTMETEIPAMLRARENVRPERFTFHSSRMRMKHVTAEELTAMDRASDRCALELSDADCDLLVYACLVAIMAQGAGYHSEAQQRLHGITREAGSPVPVVSSAGALVRALDLLGAKRVAIVTPYMRSLTALVAGYIEASGFQVVDSISLEVSDNLAVARLDPANLRMIYRDLDLSQADALVLSACVQMPSLPAIQAVEDECGLPVLSAATATVHALLTKLGLEPVVPGAGRLLAGGVHGAEPDDAAAAPRPHAAVPVRAAEAAAVTDGAE